MPAAGGSASHPLWQQLMARRRLAAPTLPRALPQEVAATAEALEAERAAKYAADEEAKQLQRMLDEASACLLLASSRCVMLLRPPMRAGWLRPLCAGLVPVLAPRRRWLLLLLAIQQVLWVLPLPYQPASFFFPPPAPRQVSKSLTTEREFAKKLGQQASQTQVELKAALSSAASLGARNTALEEDLQAR